jgi:hypothetical protein
MICFYRGRILPENCSPSRRSTLASRDPGVKFSERGKATFAGAFLWGKKYPCWGPASSQNRQKLLKSHTHSLHYGGKPSLCSAYSPPFIDECPLSLKWRSSAPGRGRLFLKMYRSAGRASPCTRRLSQRQHWPSLALYTPPVTVAVVIPAPRGRTARSYPKFFAPTRGTPGR